MALLVVDVEGYAAHDSSGHLTPFTFKRRSKGPNDVTFKVSYCGICHSDLHEIRNDWGSANYPMIPGHEMVGVVTEVGSQVTRFKIGDHVGVGCMVRSCGECDACHKKVEQFCPWTVWTYNSIDRDGTRTYGGYSSLMVVDEKFALLVPKSLPLDATAPLLCAGITVYSPMCNFGMTEAGKHLGVVGLGGLGHMAVKFAKAFGLKVTVISTSPHKEKHAREDLGVHDFFLSTDADAMSRASRTMDYILDTVPAHHELEPLLNLLAVDGKLVLLGIQLQPLDLRPGMVIPERRFVGGSLIGSLKETQEMLNFCAEKNITATIEKISVDYLNTAMDRLSNVDVMFRFVIDLGTMQKSHS